MVIHLGGMRSVSVDASAQTITFGGGCKWGDVDGAAYAHGFATPGGTVSHTGVGGLILGGGFGMLSGRHGLTIDCLVEVEVVLADGSIVTASETQNPDLFWAIRGAGSSFGVVTSFTSRLFPQGEVWSGMLLFPLPRLEEVVAFANEFVTAATQDQFLLLAFIHGPPPERPRMILANVFHNGTEEEARASVFGKLLALGPAMNMTSMMPYPKVNTLADEVFGPSQRWLFGGANVTAPLSPKLFRETAEAFYSHVDEATAQGNDMRGSALGFELFNLNNVLNVPFHSTSFANRGKYWNVVTVLNWTDAGQDQAVREWNRGFCKRIRESGHAGDADGGVGQYNNYLSAEISAEDAFGRNAERLRGLKERYDPENWFDKLWKLGPKA
jgi:FAD/FMN-containing dehydrogenase